MWDHVHCGLSRHVPSVSYQWTVPISHISIGITAVEIEWIRYHGMTNPCSVIKMKIQYFCYQLHSISLNGLQAQLFVTESWIKRQLVQNIFDWYTPTNEVKPYPNV